MNYRLVVLAATLCRLAWNAEPGYIDPAVCATCHRQAAEGYARSGMARTFGIVRPNTDAARTPPGQFHHPASGQDFSVAQRAGKLYLRRSIAGFDGRPSDVQQTEMAYWIGSGNQARSFISRGAGGKLVELPLSWYPGQGGRWAMSPGYDVPFHAGFTRKITFGCLFCHAGYPDLPAGTIPSDSDWKLPDPYASQGIDCQRCHGPGQSHVNAVLQRQSAEQVRAAIVNPRKLDSQRGMEICMQCHLETTNARLPGFLRNYGRSTFSYRAGEPLQDYILHFDRTAAAGVEQPQEFVGEAYRLRLSACFLGSRGALTCMTCHNPHNIPRGTAATRYYASICLGCHRDTVTTATRAGRHPASQDCVSCHMPKRQPADAIQTLVTDHFIRKRPAPEPAGPRLERNDATAPVYHGEVRLYYPPALPEAPESELYLAIAQVKQGANLQMGLPRLETLMAQLKPERGEFYLDLADAYRQAGEAEKAAASARTAVQKMQNNWHAWFALGTVLVASGDQASASEALRRAAALAPEETSVWGALGEAYGRQGLFQEALATFRSSLTADAEFAEGHNDTGTTLLRLGDPVGAERELREAVRLRPESAVMQANLATFLARHGAMPEAKHRFELALKLNPQAAETHMAFGSVLAEKGEWTAAKTHLQEAIRLNPKLPVARHNLGVVLAELNDREGALAQYQSAVDLDPDYYEAHLKLGILLLQNGKSAEAQPHLLKASKSPDEQVKQAAARWLR